MSQDETAVTTGEVITPTESAPVNPAPADDPLGDDAFDDIDEEVSQETGTVEPKPEAEKPAEQPKPEETDTTPQEEEKPLAPKSENRFQKLANDNKAKDEIIRQQAERLAQLEMRDTQLATEQQMLGEVNPETGEYYTPQEIQRLSYEQRIQAEREQLSQDKYEVEVQKNQQTIQSETEQALKDFPIFDEKSPEFNKELAEHLDSLLSNALIFDDKQRIIGSHVSPYQLSKAIADAAKSSEAKAQAAAQKATEQMLANVDDTGSGTPPPKGDQDLDDFDSAWDN